MLRTNLLIYHIGHARIGVPKARNFKENCRVRRLSTYRVAEALYSYLTFSISETPVILGTSDTRIQMPYPTRHTPPFLQLHHRLEQQFQNTAKALLLHRFIRCDIEGRDLFITKDEAQSAYRIALCDRGGDVLGKLELLL